MTVDTLDNVLDELVSRLERVSDTPALDAQALLARVTGKPRSWVLAHPEALLSPRQAAALEGLIGRLERGEPLPYVLGRWEFFGLEFEVTPDVLIPRPETELLVERAVGWLESKGSEKGEWRVADVGTGSGCIAVAVAVHVPGARILASDISPAALEVARRNAHRHGVADRVEMICCDLLPPLQGGENLPEFDLIVANLPYIPTATLERLPVYHREPTLALDGGADGLDIIRRLLTLAPSYLVAGGLMLLEIEASQGLAALSLAYDAFEQASIHLHQDLSGRDRLLEVQKEDLSS